MKEQLAGMARIPQFFVWRLRWMPEKNKYQKVPFSPDGMTEIDHTAPVNWMTYDNAIFAVNSLRQCTPQNSGITWTLGFSLTADSGYFFLDCDAAITRDGNYANALHKWLVDSLPGAAFEYSSSGTGFHLFGRGNLPPHACKTKKAIIAANPMAEGLELYTDKRGIAFGLSGQMFGCADTDHTAVMQAYIIPQLFPQTAEDLQTFDALDFTDYPQDARWIGPEDDEDLIRRATQSSNVHDKLSGSKGLFQALWDNDTAALGNRYPGDSEKDMALIAQLAFWTGKNPVRIERLMMRSKLVREKWHDRRGDLTWLQYSILEQLRKPMNVLQDKRVDVPTDTPQEGDTSLVLLGRDDQKIWFKDCVYVMDEDAILTPIREGYSALLNRARFNAMRGGKVFIIDQDNSKITRQPWEAFIDNQIVRWPRVDTTTFRPDLPHGEITEDTATQRTMINIWRPPVIRHVKGDPGWFMYLVKKLLPDERDQRILLSYMAAVKQFPGKKFRWCPVLQGTKGNGKSTLAEILAECIGRSLVSYPTTKQLIGKFNNWQVNKLLAVVNDVSIRPGDTTAMEHIRPMISDEYANVEGKGKDIETKAVCINYFMSMNRKDGVLRDDDERRFAIFFTAQQTAEDVARDFPGGFFINLNTWLNYHDGYAICADFLQNYPVEDEFNPAAGCQRAPRTSSEPEVVEANADPVTQGLKELIDAEVLGFKNGWVSITRARECLQEAGIRNATPREIKILLSKLGYVPHPGLGKESRTSIPVMSEGNRKVMVWVKKDHYSFAYLGTEGPAYFSRLFISDNSFGFQPSII